MSATTSRVRRARKVHPSCCKPIQPGELYVEHTEFPGGESGYADAAGHPVRMAECRSCAERYGRAPLIDAYLKSSRPVCPHRGLCRYEAGCDGCYKVVAAVGGVTGEQPHA